MNGAPVLLPVKAAAPCFKLCCRNRVSVKASQAKAQTCRATALLSPISSAMIAPAMAQ